MTLKRICALALLLFPLPFVPVTVAAQTVPASTLASKSPALVLLIRHAEKPLGDQKLSDLAPEGFHRADLLPTLFLAPAGSTKPPRFPRPDAIFATDTSKHSNRPIETVTPLARALRLRIDHEYADSEVAAIAKELLSGKYAGKVVLVCWHHGELPHLAEALGVSNAPKKWDDNVFDKIWMIQWAGDTAQFDVMTEDLLLGDAKR